MTWIYCTDRLPAVPPVGEAFAPYVLVTTMSGDVRRGRPFYIDEGVAGVASLSFAGWRTDGEGWDIRVKAWMPLPEPAP